MRLKASSRGLAFCFKRRIEPWIRISHLSSLRSFRSRRSWAAPSSRSRTRVWPRGRGSPMSRRRGSRSSRARCTGCSRSWSRRKSGWILRNGCWRRGRGRRDACAEPLGHGPNVCRDLGILPLVAAHAVGLGCCLSASLSPLQENHSSDIAWFVRDRPPHCVALWVVRHRKQELFWLDLRRRIGPILEGHLFQKEVRVSEPASSELWPSEGA